jgi:lipoprotein signal peptidase
MDAVCSSNRERDDLRFYYYWIALILFLLDFISKKVIEKNMEIGETIHIIGEKFFIITSIRNRGAAFSILQEQRILFLCITSLVAISIIWYLQINRFSGRVPLLIGLGMVLGGALGNFFDRALYGQVIDFLQFTFGSYVFPSFNLADSGICCGVFLILLDTIFSRQKEIGKRHVPENQ